MDITIKQLTAADANAFAQLLRIYESVFEWEAFTLPGNAHLQRMLANPAFLVFVAVHENETIGGLTIHLLPRYDSEKYSAYIYDVGVSENFQRRGIGQQLIAAAAAYCKANGCSEMFVQAETEDEHAVQFYRKTPVSSELHAVHFTYSFDNGNG